MKRRTGRRSTRWLLGISVVLLAVVGGLIALYAYPPQGNSARADVVYVIGPPTPSRIDEAQSILRADVAETLLISVSPPQSKGDKNYVAANMSVCSQPGVECDSPEPMTTKGEALLLNEYARTHDVHKAAVITFTPHVARTRYIFARCAPDIDVQVIGVDEHLSIGDWIYQFGYQTTAFAKAITTPCASDDE